AVYSAVEKIPSQARRYYPIPIGRNTVAELRGFLNHLRTSDPSLPEYKSDAGDLLATAYLAVDRNMGWLNVVMYSRHRRWLEGEHDPVSLLREFADGDLRGKEVFVENGLARIPGADGLAQKLLYGQMPVAINTIGDADRARLLAMKVLDTASSKAFVELYPLRASLSDLLETAHQDAGVQVVSGGGATVMAGDMKIDLARLLDDLAAYKADDAGRPVLPKDHDAFVLHLTALHGISHTGAAAQYLYPVFAKHIGEKATHFGPSFAALRQIDKRLQREDLQFRLLDDEEQERKFNQRMAGLIGAERQRRLVRGLLRILEENQAPAEMNAEPSMVVASAKIERTDALALSQDSKIWMVAGDRGSSARDAVESLCTQDKPVYPILLMLSTDDPSQRDLIDQFLQNRPAIAERVFQFPLAEVDERLLILKSENYGDDSLTNLARSLLYRLTERSKQALTDRFNQQVTLGAVVWPIFRNERWKPYGEALAELWLYLAADASHSLIDAEARFGQNRVQNAKDALDENEMRTGGAAQGATLVQDAQVLEEHVRNRNLPFRDLADALGVFVKKLETRVTLWHGQISTAKADYKGRLDAAGLPSTVFEAPAEALLVLTKRDQQLAHTTKGVLASETLIHHLVQKNLKKAEQCVEEAEQRLARLKTGSNAWIQSWDGFANQVKALKQEYDGYDKQVKELAARAGDSVFVKNHLAQLKTLLKPKLDEAGDVLEGLQDSLDGDYAEIVVFTPDMPEFRTKYAGKNNLLALALDQFDLDEFSAVLPGLSEPQQRVLDAALRYWAKKTQPPRATDTLLAVLTDRLGDLQSWDELSEAEANALNARSAAVVAIRLRRLINESRSFYCTGMDTPLDIKGIIGRPQEVGGRLVIVDLQGVSDSARQIVVALLSTFSPRRS
ncbi:MAG: helicase HerA domain-containing protein, partial [Gemmataceae bacterium]